MDTKDREEKIDMLELIFRHQKELDDFIKKERNLDFSTEEWMQKKSMALIAETTELLNEVNYKWWKNRKELSLPAIKEELVDILHFLIGMCIDVGLTPKEMFEIYLNKNRENHNRQTGLSSKSGYKITDNNKK